MARISSREDLKQYALRDLGAPLLLINVDDQQLEDRIDDALDLFLEYHFYGTERVYLHHQLTQDDINNQEIVLPDGVMSVLDVLRQGVGDGGGGNGIATINLQYQMYLTDVMNVRKIMMGGLSSFYITQSYLNTIADTFGQPDRLTFNMHNDRLKLLTDWSLMTVGSWVAIECYRAINPDDVGAVYNNRWLKKYTCALFRKQWGQNLIKFGNAQLPGGITTNGEAILQQAITEVKELEEELQNNYQDPVDFFMA
ncbi:neck protein [Stenotrophomonas phage Mendera]|uniref:Neck protein n=1 Tax=Stenotrophomonas phage Mendera TaxID=2650877 RepID=A0A5P8PLC5_9CAUD|nr:neck protein [Stenotrophomonas phage Mendera]QFR56830.1 neck protein [Stenotrophomonas phage Mendera]